MRGVVWSLLHIPLNASAVLLAALLENLSSSESATPTLAYSAGYAIGVGCLCTVCQAAMHTSCQHGAAARRSKAQRTCVRLIFAGLMAAVPHLGLCVMGHGQHEDEAGAECDVVHLSMVEALLLVAASACEFVLQAREKASAGRLSKELVEHDKR